MKLEKNRKICDSTENSVGEPGKKKINIEPLNPMVFYPRFEHIVEKVFAKLDNKSLSNCREIAKSWQECIDNANFRWIENVNIPIILKDKEDIFGHNKMTYLHLAARYGHVKIFQEIFEKEVVKNPKSPENKTPFHFACEYGLFAIAKILVKKFTELKIQLNEEDIFGNTSFHYACENGHFKIVEMLLENAANLDIELDAKNNYEYTGFQIACENGHLNKQTRY